MARLNSILAILLVAWTGNAQDIIAPGPIMRTIGSAGSTLNTGLVAYWTMDETSDGSAPVTREDSEPTGTAQDLSDVPDAPYVKHAAGKLGNAAVFTPTDASYLQHNTSADLVTGDIDFSIACWVYLDNLPAAGSTVGIVTKRGAAGQREYRLIFNGSTRDFEFVVSADGTTEALVSMDPLSVFNGASDTWYFIACGHKNGANIWISYNGGAKNTLEHLTGVFESNNQVSIGAQNTASILDGMIDEVGFWKKELSDDEIDELYNGGTGLTCCGF